MSFRNQPVGVSLGTFSCFQSKEGDVKRSRIGVDLSEVGEAPVPHIARIDNELLKFRSLCGEHFEPAFDASSPFVIGRVDVFAADIGKLRVIFGREPQDGETLFCHGLILSSLSGSATMADGRIVSSGAPKSAALA